MPAIVTGMLQVMQSHCSVHSSILINLKAHSIRSLHKSSHARLATDSECAVRPRSAIERDRKRRDLCADFPLP